MSGEREEAEDQYIGDIPGLFRLQKVKAILCLKSYANGQMTLADALDHINGIHLAVQNSYDELCRGEQAAKLTDEKKANLEQGKPLFEIQSPLDYLYEKFPLSTEVYDVRRSIEAIHFALMDIGRKEYIRGPWYAESFRIVSEAMTNCIMALQGLNSREVEVQVIKFFKEAEQQKGETNP